MNEIIFFIEDYIGLISIIVCIWFAYDCKRLKRFFTNKIEWSLYTIFASCMSYSNHALMSTLPFKF